MGDFDTFSEVTAGQLHPTPYADVNAVLHDFQGRIQAILVNHFIGMYLYGSLALGDFDPHSSDIDFIVVTDKELADDAFEALKEMHARFDESPSVWAGKVEAAYIPLQALSHMAPTDVTYPQVEKGTALFKGPLEIGWIFQRHTMREHGVIVAGPDPHTLVDPVDPSDMRRAVSALPEMWLEQARNDHSWLEWVCQREAQAFVVLTLCRLLYTLDTADVASKPAAAHWAQKALGKRWAGLIEHALVGQHDEGEISDSEMGDTIALIEYTVERSQQ